MLDKDAQIKHSLRDYWQIFLRRKWLIILPIIIIPAIAIPGSFFMKPVYEARTSLISQEMSRGFMQSAVNIDVPRGEELNTIRYKIQSVTNMKEVADKVGIASYLKSIGKHSEFVDQVKYLRDITKLDSRGGLIIEITVQHPSAKMAKEIADTIADTYINKTLNWRQKSAEGVTTFIGQELETYKNKLLEAEDALVKYRQKGVLESLNVEDNIMVTELAKLRSNLVEVELDLQEANNELENVRRLSASGNSSSYSSSLYILDPEINRLQRKLDDLQQQYGQLSMRYTDDYPPQRKLKQEIAQTMDDLKQARTNIDIRRQNAEEQTKYWEDRVRTLQLKRLAINEKILEYDQKLQQLPQKQLELARLQREKAAAENTYSMLLARQDESDLVKSSETNNIGRIAEILDRAIEPSKPIKPNRKKIAVLAFAMGIMLGGGATFLLEYFDRSFHSVDEVVSYLGVPVIATIPKLSTNENLKHYSFRKLLSITIIVLVSLLFFALIIDILSSQFMARESFFLNIIRSLNNYRKALF